MRFAHIKRQHNPWQTETLLFSYMHTSCLIYIATCKASITIYIVLGCSLSSAIFFSLKLYIQYFRKKWMKFKFKRRILKLEISFKSLSHFLSLIIFTYKKLWVEKIFFSLCWFVTCPNQIWENFWLSIVKAWNFPYKIVFYKYSYNFLFLSYSQVKLNKDSDLIAHNSIKN